MIHTIALLFSLFAAQPIILNVDAREAARGLFHVTEQIPATPGKLRLWYPKWLPGYHSPGGPVDSNILFRVLADGKLLPWKRDQVEMYEVTVDVPSGTHEVTIELTQTETYGSAHLARVDWNELLWYPAGPSDDVMVQANLLLPDKWQAACALRGKGTPDRVEYEAASLTRLVDSPALIGRHYRQYDITGSSPVKHYLEVFADTSEGVNAPDKVLDYARRTHLEMESITGTTHYREYHWLLSLSDTGGEAGLEHHESSEDGVPANGFGDGEVYLGDLLCHEYFHSYNGKFRRPDGLCTPDYTKPMKDELLWVYEGLTQYMGHLLACRAGWWTPEQWREQMALNYVEMNMHRGREWRPLVDTAVGVPATNYFRQGPSWQSARRTADYYVEMTIVWLEVDMKIRELTQGKKSLLDFERIFYGGPSNGPELKPYTFDGVVADLNRVVKYDWAGLLRERVYSLQPELSLKGFDMAGWKLVYNDTPNVMTGLLYGSRDGLLLVSSLGLFVGKEATIQDVVPGSPADKAGLTPDMKIISVNGTKYSDALLTQVTKTGGTIDIVASYKDDVRQLKIQYGGGLRIPHLERIPGTPDRFDDLLNSLSR